MITIRYIEAGGLTFRCRVAGERGEPVILLHGFPETSHIWVPLLAELAAEGYACVAPDQRGYSPGARPDGVEHYTYAAIAGDILAIADAAGFERFHLIGHDWGAIAGWALLALEPERVASWTALSVPHVAAFGRAIREDPDQQERSQYISFFQEPGVAEAALSADDYAALKSVSSADSPEGIEECLSVLRQPGALTATLNWYRASHGIDPDAGGVPFGPVATPTLHIWGNRDSAIGRKATADTRQYMTGPYRFVELDAGHWLMQEAGGQVAEAVLSHLRANPIEGRTDGERRGPVEFASLDPSAIRQS